MCLMGEVASTALLAPQLECPVTSINNDMADPISNASPIGDDDEPDEWDKRIANTGCAMENMKLNDCFFEKKDWRLCKKEMDQFKSCWKKQRNDERTSMKDM
ncbi:hypothetical protein B0O99DRAFT_686071 [Bisporella sp. PMI_857]|nr:hypothetical protein B0O99DRAFT_686071 [Bisporella sp. PMI_857]